MTWSFMFKPKGGHRFFINEEGRVAVADNEGLRPDEMLYLDQNVPVKTGEYGIFAVVDDRGERSSILESAGNAIEVAEKLGMLVESPRGKKYRLESA